MGRKSKITSGPEEVRATIDKLIRKGQLTLEQMRQYVAEQFGEEAVPSTSSLHRYAFAQRELLDRMRSIDAAARVVVEELGESPDNRAGALLVQSITTLAADAALRAHEDPDTSIEDVRKLARASADLTRASKLTRQERELAEQRAHERLQREQTEKLDQMVAEHGMSSEQAGFWRREFLGIRS